MPGNARKCRKWVRESVKNTARQSSNLSRSDSIRTSRTEPIGGGSKSLSRTSSIGSIASLNSLSSCGSSGSAKRIFVEIDYDVGGGDEGSSSGDLELRRNSSIRRSIKSLRSSVSSKISQDKRRSLGNVRCWSEDFNPDDEDFLVRFYCTVQAFKFSVLKCVVLAFAFVFYVFLFLT